MSAALSYISSNIEVLLRKTLELYIIDYSLRITYNNGEVVNMEKRTTKLILNTSGGTASKGAANYKIALPTTWKQQMLAAQFGNSRSRTLIFHNSCA